MIFFQGLLHFYQFSIILFIQNKIIKKSLLSKIYMENKNQTKQLIYNLKENLSEQNLQSLNELTNKKGLKIFFGILQEKIFDDKDFSQFSQESSLLLIQFLRQQKMAISKIKNKYGIRDINNQINEYLSQLEGNFKKTASYQKQLNNITIKELVLNEQEQLFVEILNQIYDNLIQINKEYVEDNFNQKNYLLLKKFLIKEIQRQQQNQNIFQISSQQSEKNSQEIEDLVFQYIHENQNQSLEQKEFFQLDTIIQTQQRQQVAFNYFNFPLQKDEQQYESIFWLKKQVCAFLNQQGGVIYLGIDQKDQIVKGIQMEENDKFRVQFTFLKDIEKDFQPSIKELLSIQFYPTLQDQQWIPQTWIIAIIVQPGPCNIPYTFRNKSQNKNQRENLIQKEVCFKQNNEDIYCFLRKVQGGKIFQVKTQQDMIGMEEYRRRKIKRYISSVQVAEPYKQGVIACENVQENKKNLKSRKKSLEMLDAELSKKKALICSSIDDFKTVTKQDEPKFNLSYFFTNILAEKTQEIVEIFCRSFSLLPNRDVNFILYKEGMIVKFMNTQQFIMKQEMINKKKEQVIKQIQGLQKNNKNVQFELLKLNISFKFNPDLKRDSIKTAISKLYFVQQQFIFEDYIVIEFENELSYIEGLFYFQQNKQKLSNIGLQI